MKFFSIVTVLSSMAMLLSDVSAVHLNTEADNRLEQMESLYADLLSDEEAMEEWGFDWNAIKRKIKQAKRWAKIEAAKAKRRIARAIKKAQKGDLLGAVKGGIADLGKGLKEGKAAAKWVKQAQKDTGVNVGSVTDALKDTVAGKIDPAEIKAMASAGKSALA